MQCSFCKGEHEGFGTCKEGKAVLRRLKKRNKQQKNDAMNKAIEWPRPETVVRQWTAFGLECAIARGHCFCGYVKVPKGHPDARHYHDDVQVQVHGGLTFRCKAKDGGAWFGFDTAHAGDVIDEYEERLGGALGLGQGGRVWNSQDVMIETQRLARAFAERARGDQP